jgi:hypothetical protein
METRNSAFIAPPRFLSVEFHTRFFPAFLWGRLRHKQRTGSGFNSSFELYLVLTICVVLVAIGVPAALSHRSIAGWIIGAIGAAGFLAMLIISILSRRGAPPSYDGFLVGFFFFFVVFGLSAGIFIGALVHYPLFQGLLVGAAGLLAGYLMGILAGLALQYIGWLAAVLDPLAGLVVFGMLVVDLVLLC